MLSSMNPQVTAALLDAGWHEGRDVDVSDWVRRLEEGGFSLNDQAVSVWRSLGGLTIRSSDDREPASSLRIDPVDACGDRVEESEMLRDRHGIDYSPMGLWSEQFRAYIGDDGRVIATQLGQEYLLGNGVPEALEFVVSGHADGNRRPWMYEASGDPALAAQDAGSRKMFLESAGLIVNDPLWTGPVPSRTGVWRMLRSRNIDPAAVIPDDGSPGSLAVVQGIWREKSAGAGLFGIDGEFIISTPGNKWNGLPWSLVRATENIRILGELARQRIKTEFVSMSVDGRVASAVRIEGDSLIVLAVQYMSGDSLAIGSR